ncbi:MAG: hypothetical protein IPG91_02040 [Ideonella sp.]|nr:hypothetical protein [Ideonella sp.]
MLPKSHPPSPAARRSLQRVGLVRRGLDAVNGPKRPRYFAGLGLCLGDRTQGACPFFSVLEGGDDLERLLARPRSTSDIASLGLCVCYREQSAGFHGSMGNGAGGLLCNGDVACPGLFLGNHIAGFYPRVSVQDGGGGIHRPRDVPSHGLQHGDLTQGGVLGGSVSDGSCGLQRLRHILGNHLPARNQPQRQVFVFEFSGCRSGLQEDLASFGETIDGLGRGGWRGAAGDEHRHHHRATPFRQDVIQDHGALLSG